MPNLIEGDNLTKKGAGRPKGSPNKVGKAAKDAIAEAAENLGGVSRLVEWAREDPLNERAFWATIYPKLLPLQVNADVQGNLTIISGVPRAISAPLAPAQAYWNERTDEHNGD